MKWFKKRTMRFGAFVMVLVIFLSGFPAGSRAEAATGYHTGYHAEGHDTFYVEVTEDGVVRRQYRYWCGGDWWKRYQWTWYTSGGVSWGEGVIFNKGTIVSVEAIGYDEFCSKYNVGRTDCMGYDVPNTYYVAYKANGGTGTMANQTATYDTAFQLRTNTFVRTGYTFNGWSGSNGGSYSNGQSVKNLTATHGATVTMTARWTAVDYTVAFHANGGTCSLDSKNVTYQSTYGTLPVPVRPGYRFLGWFTASSGGTQYTSDTKVTTASDHTLYAHWEASSNTVTYDANGGSSVSLESAVVGYGEQIDLNPTANKEGYIFVGWNTDPAAKEGLASIAMQGEDVTLYAIYSIPVSDVKEMYVQSWVPGKPEDYRIYPLTRKLENNMVYVYEMEETNIAADFGNVPVAYSLFVWDHAGNYRILKTRYPDPASPEEPVVPEWFLQTVNHYRYDIIARDWILFETVSEEIMKGETYTPRYISPPTGYKEDHIDGPYVVEGDATKGAYYSPISYILTFDPNGGTCDTENRTIRYGEVYGELPAAERPGYIFLGWFTDPDGGTRITASDKYELTEDSTVYAHWKIREHTVYYDYRTNGGTSADKEYEVLNYGTEIDLNTGAVKPGWEHIGWNTDPDAETGLDTCTVKDKDVTLYAIYRKVITVTYIDSNGSDAAGEPVPTVRKEAVTIYNKAKRAGFPIPELNDLTGWQKEGWSLSEEADAEVDASAGTVFMADSDTTLYGRYSKEVTVSYDTNGSAVEIPEEMKVRQYNASGERMNPVFTLADAPELDNYSFVNWKDKNDNEYREGQVVVCKEDTKFTAIWDKYPEIEAYDRYFTLEQAKNGEITPTVLLEKVKGTDREDGTLTNGTDVIVINHQPEDFTRFTAGGSVTVTYQATDSFGNMATKTVTVHIADTSLKEDKTKQYVRFISRQFYHNGADYVTAELGGLEVLSVWRTNVLYKAALEDALSNVKTNETLINVGLFGKDYKVIQPGTGSWNHSMETWELTKEQIAEVKEYINANGYGNYKSADGLAGFRSRFLE